MRVLRGRAATISADRKRTGAMLDRTAETGEPAVRVWTPHRQVAFGRRDAAEPGYDRARAAARERGFEPVERRVGGRAVAYTGSTVAFAHAVPVESPRTGLDDRYAAAAARLRRALASLGVDAEPGEPTDSFCPGSHSLQCAGKLVGIAQRVRTDAALVAGCVVVADRDAFASVLAAVYDALGQPFDPASVGSVAAAGGPSDPARVVEAVERELVGDAATTIHEV
ncbi:lipoyl protein ligase domain-containing protein [Haloplanus aerogenes]|uniref:Lipoate--protein ligase family protein n=1 Tax=Haloplanus aerogenes TaxID=660522 RepID=A0A3M0DR44_9EURY|nr:lipoate--protein ligase family protein [Haloplanus aerogenes]AZH24329.1 lipoate--protein ligase family protein [Haloplanus aerogenes]RMB24037.1 lipoate-protein ligase A [Haloplanus aerogenes]